MDNYPARGPLGSTDMTCPSDVDTLYDELHADDSSLRDLWREADEQEWVKTLGLPCRGAKL